MSPDNAVTRRAPVAAEDTPAEWVPKVSLTSHWIPALRQAQGKLFAGMTAFTGPHEKSTSPK
jgi:hypothetical protein